MKRVIFAVLFLIVLPARSASVYIQVLGIAQDGGIPHVGCNHIVCKRLNQESNQYHVASLGLVDTQSKQFWLFDSTFQFPYQYTKISDQSKSSLAGIFLTHAHIGHYTGLMFLGREVMGANKIPVYAMPRMGQFLRTNGPWSQLVTLKNILLNRLDDNKGVTINSRIKVTPHIVPHRDEYSETVGFVIQGPNRKVLYIPDIDKWEKWDQSINQWIKKVDRAYLDATFFDENELQRNISEIPHPLVKESMKRFQSLSHSDRQKIYFIHFNHSNPLLFPNSKQLKHLLGSGYHIAQEGDIFNL